MSFGKILQEIRRSRENLTQRDVAKEIGMDFSYYSKLENDRMESKPTRETIDKIAIGLKCTQEELNRLLSAAGKATQEIEEAARIVNKNPELGAPLGKLFKAAINFSPEKINKIAERVEREALKEKIKNSEKK